MDASLHAKGVEITIAQHLAAGSAAPPAAEL
jgi:hypothetical protein